jgi:hypothetical protein
MPQKVLCGPHNSCYAVLIEAVALYREAQAMNPQPNQPFTDLDTLSTAAGAKPGGFVGVQVFGSSSVMDDMALAAAWLAIATGGLLGLVCHQKLQGFPVGQLASG